MTFKDSEVPTISDLITYFGVPLTVIGALPIVYNVFVTLVHLQRIRRVLTRNEMAALARIHSDIFNRVVEVELPKYFIQSPTDSSATESRSIGSDRGIQLRNLGPGTSRLREGFSKPTKPSDIPGGSWTFLEWEPHQIRSKTQRTKPGDKLRQPQAQIRFWDLILRLYQLGARVTIDKKDWSELHSSPLWTRERNLITVDDQETSSLVLRVASYSDSDSPISLEFVRTGPRGDWSSLHRDRSGLFKPGFINLPCQAQRDHSNQEAGDGLAADAVSIICQVTKVGAAVSASSTTGETFSTEHLRIDDDHSHQGIWFASCAMTLYAHSPTPILDYRVPDNIRWLAKAEIIPHDVIDALYGNGVEEIPPRVTTRYLLEWKYHGRERDKPGHQQQIPPTDDMARREMDIRKKHDSESDLENMLSTPPRKGPELQRASISWLPAQGHIPHEESAEEAIKAILSRMVTDQDFSRSLGQMLENWCEWARRGAMNVADFCDIYQDKATFARAILLIVTLSEIENGPAAALIIMQECAAKWDYVELG